MLKRSCLLAAALVVLGTSLSGQGPRRVALGDWPEMRGPKRDGTSAETGLIEKWALNGENFLWRVPYGGRSTPDRHGQPRVRAEPVRTRRRRSRSA